MSRRRCCCGCPEVADDFERADSDDLGPLWFPNEDARIVDGCLEIDAGYVVCIRRIWDTSGGSFLALATLDAPVDDDDVYDVVLLKKDNGTFTEK